VHWCLLTTHAVNTADDAKRMVRWYQMRWPIEVLNRILKSGCQIEDRQLGTADRLEACLAIDAVVAWRIHHLTYLGRVTPDLPCDAVFEDDLWKGVIVFRTRKPPAGESAHAARDDPHDRRFGRLPEPQIGWRAGKRNTLARAATRRRYRDHVPRCS
jgi:hypothetical protein